jgi:secondary thiamine-phosphate synthase enzyme
MFQTRLPIRTSGRGIHAITDEVARAVSGAGTQTGLCHVFIRHTSASLIVCENADPAVRRDLANFMARLVPEGDPRYEHDTEGPDDMPAHIRSVLTQTSLTVPVTGGRLALGTWQGIFVWEHRAAGAEREVVVTVAG